MAFPIHIQTAARFGSESGATGHARSGETRNISPHSAPQGVVAALRKESRQHPDCSRASDQRL